MEVKCRRCKRLVELPLDGLPEIFVKRKERPLPEPRRAADGPRPVSPRPYSSPRPRDTQRPPDTRGQACISCGQIKPSLLYGKCIECRTESIKIQYRSKLR
jgi:hypothetical protein